MQIDSSGSITSLVQSTKEGKSAKNNQVADQQNQQQKSEQSQQSGHTDTVTFTPAAAQLQQVEQYIKSAPVTDTQKIEQVQSAIKTDSYDPDPAQVADKMLSFESALNSVRSRP